MGTENLFVKTKINHTGGEDCDALVSHLVRCSNTPNCLIMQKLDTLFAEVMRNLHPLFNSNHDQMKRKLKIVRISKILIIHYKICLLRSNN